MTSGAIASVISLSIFASDTLHTTFLVDCVDPTTLEASQIAIGRVTAGAGSGSAAGGVDDDDEENSEARYTAVKFSWDFT